MPPALLASQLQTLERLGAAEDGIVLDIGHDPATLVARAMAWLTIDEEL